MNNEQRKQEFIAAYKDYNNHLTPKVLKYGSISKTLIYELSTGKSILKGYGDVYEVTVLKLQGEGEALKMYDLGKCFNSLNEAKRYIKSLSEEFKNGI